eukprot:6180715-Pleurochrysis_carterae.AAC.2
MQRKKEMQRKKPLKLQWGGNFGGGKTGNGGEKTLKELVEEVEALEEVYKERLVARERACAAEVEAGGRAAITRMSHDGAQRALSKLRAKRARVDEAPSAKTPAAAAEAAGTHAEAATLAEETPSGLFGGSTSTRLAEGVGGEAVGGEGEGAVAGGSDWADNMDEEGSATARTKGIKRSR